MSALFLIAEIETKTRGNGYQGKLRFPDRPAIKDIPLPNLQLDQGTVVPHVKSAKTLGEWVKILAEFRPNDPSQPLAQFWNERAQLDLGEYLAGQLFEMLPRIAKQELNAAESVRLVIRTEDEFLARIPWACLVWDRQPAATGCWTIALSSQTVFETKTVEFPRTPSLLVIAPDASDHKTTGAEDHLKELEKILSDGDTSYRLETKDNLRVVRTWAELKAALKERAPDAVYYYGHGARVGGDRLKLIFEDGSHQSRGKEMDVLTFGKLLEEADPRPFIVYVNCCQGDCEGPTSIGWQLSGRFDAVVTNRTTAFQNLARRQACEFWLHLLRRERTPEEALRAVYKLADTLEHNFSEPHWMTPVLYVGYGAWAHAKTNGPALHPHWPDLVDRSAQFGHVLQSVGTLVDHQDLVGSAFVWMGGEKAGIESFHNRLQVELEKQLKGRCVLQAVPLAWPQVFPLGAGVNQLFGDMLRTALKSRSFDEIAGCLRRMAKTMRGEKILMYLRHIPIESRQRFAPELLKAYLKWWAENVLEHLDGNQRCILGISYRIPDAEALDFYNELKSRKRSGLEGCLPGNAECVVLKPLDLVPEDDLARFLRIHPIVPRERIDDVAESIIGVTGGHYADIVKILEYILKHGLPIGDLDAWLRRILGGDANDRGGPKK